MNLHFWLLVQYLHLYVLENAHIHKAVCNDVKQWLYFLKIVIWNKSSNRNKMLQYAYECCIKKTHHINYFYSAIPNITMEKIKGLIIDS